MQQALTARVSTNMQRAAVAVAVAAIVGALWYLQRPPASTAPPTSEDPPPAAKHTIGTVIDAHPLFEDNGKLGDEAKP